MDQSSSHQQDHGKDSVYLLPNDAPERERLDEQHVAFTELMHGHMFHAPVKAPQRILDVGCGTGAATYVFGQMFPDTQVIGVDPVPVPAAGRKIKNVSFLQGRMPQIASSGHSDFFAKASYDLIFGRLLTAGIVHWQEYVHAVASLLRPGGYMESQELAMGWFVGEARCDRDWDWASIFKAEAVNKGMDLECGKNMETYMRNAGLKIVERKIYQWPWGSWLAEAGHPESKRLGDLSLSTSSMFTGMIERMLGGTQYSNQRIADLQAEASRTLRGGQKMHIWWYVTIGRKPS